MDTQLKKRIMRRIHMVYVLKRVLSPFMIKLYGLVVAILAVSALVSVPNIVANFLSVASGGIPYGYIISAFTHTELAVQAGSFVVLLLLVWTIRDIATSLREGQRAHASV